MEERRRWRRGGEDGEMMGREMKDEREERRR